MHNESRYNNIKSIFLIILTDAINIIEYGGIPLFGTPLGTVLSVLINGDVLISGVVLYTSFT